MRVEGMSKPKETNTVHAFQPQWRAQISARLHGLSRKAEATARIERRYAKPRGLLAKLGIQTRVPG